MKSSPLANSIVLLIVLLFLLFPSQKDGLAQSDIDIAVHYVEGKPAEDGNSYNVTVYLSVVDGLGFPIRDLTSDMFWVTEDSQDVGIQGLKMVESEPTNVILAVDISEGQTGIGNNNLKDSLKTLLALLKTNDQVGILTFAETIENQIGYGTDRIASANFLDLIPGFRDVGTCVYDAAYSAVQMASTLASESRAVIMITDGIDQTSTGAICSIHTADDVINLASAGATRTPVFIVELGGLGDSNTLRRIADVTGGLYLDASDARALNNSIQQLADDLRSQYILTYQSFAGSGPHAVSVGVNHSAGQAIDTRNFVLPVLPTRIAFLTPREGEAIGDSLKAEVSLLSQGESIARVAFEINGKVVDTDDTKPYELDADVSQYPAGMLTLTAIAYGLSDNKLASSTANIVHTVSAPAPTVEAATSVVSSPPENTAPTIKPIMLVGIALGGLGIFTIALLVSLLIHQQQKDNGVEEAEAINSSLFSQAQGIEAISDVYRTKKAERRTAVKPDTYGTLLVETSDDATLVGHLFYIIAEQTTLGRSADNNIPFPKDNPVSRQHAEIFFKGGRLYLKQVQSKDADGESVLPRYGTYLNERPLGLDPVALKTGDKIVLGKRVRLKFEAGEKLNILDSRTIDDVTTDNDDYDVDRTNTQQ
jgi:hypothetical protein